MSRTLFTNAMIFDGSGSGLFPGEVLVEENRITAVARTVRRDRARRRHGYRCRPRNADAGHDRGARAYQHVRHCQPEGSRQPAGRGACAGNRPQCEAHARLRFHQPLFGSLREAPAGSRHSQRNQCRPPPRPAAARGLSRRSAPPAASATSVSFICTTPASRSSPTARDEMRRVARTMIREGVDTIKVNISGDNYVRPGFGEACAYTDAEVEAVASRRMPGAAGCPAMPAPTRRCAWRFGIASA